MTRDRVDVLHALPRRVRLRARALVGQRAACERIAEELAAHIDFDSISVRPITGSIVVVRAAGGLDAADLRRRLAEFVATERGDDGRPLTEERDVGNGNTRIAAAVAFAVRRLNDQVRDALDGEADLQILAPIALAAASVLEPAAKGKLFAPPWSQLAWYAFRSFMSFNREAIEGEAKGHSPGPAEVTATPPSAVPPV
jgi:hypothetical protein